MSTTGVSELASLDLFAGLGPAEVDQATAGLRPLTLRSGDPFDIAATEAACCLLAEGRLALAVIDADRERTIAMLEPGQLLVRPTNSWAALGPGVRCYAACDATLMLVEQPQLDGWLAVPGLAGNLVRLLTDAVAERELAIAIALEPTVERRLLLKLRQLAERWGRVTPDGIRLDLRLTHQELANMVGAVRESVTIALGRLADAGLIEVRNRALLVRVPGDDPPPDSTD